MAIRVSEAEKQGPCVLRLFDMFDGWLDVYGPAPFEECLEKYNKKTANGTKNTGYGNGDYWAIYPAGTQMLYTPELLGR